MAQGDILAANGTFNTMTRYFFAALLLLSLCSSVQAANAKRGEAVVEQCRRGSTQPVHEEGFVAIGGIEQWVTVKGDNCANPIILFISGGPGNPLSPYSDAVYGAWSKDFTLVQWDQRGAGMTYGRSPPTRDAVLSGLPGPPLTK